MNKVFHEDRNLKREITLLRKWCYLKLTELLERWNGTDEQKNELEESNRRFTEKGL